MLLKQVNLGRRTRRGLIRAGFCRINSSLDRAGEERWLLEEGPRGLQLEGSGARDI